MAAPRQKQIVKSCAHCQEEFTSHWARQKYCSACQVIKKSSSALQGMAVVKESKSLAFAAVAFSSSKERRSLPGAFERPDYEWTVSFKVPHQISASKNSRWAQMSGGRGVFIPKHVRSYSDLIALQAKRALEGQKIYENRVWLSLFVQKPTHKSDAVNVVDTFCDAIKSVIGVDDRWFSLDVVDWEIRKFEPQIYVRIGQADCFDARACSYCGGVFPLSSFTKKSSNRLGVGRECRECLSAVGLKRRELRGAGDESKTS